MNFKVSIPGVDYDALKDYVLIFNNKQISGTKLTLNINNNNTKINSQNSVNWLIDHIFNQGDLYTHMNNRTGMEWSHYDDKIKWDQAKQQTLIFTGKLKKRVPGHPWTYL